MQLILALALAVQVFLILAHVLQVMYAVPTSKILLTRL
jgi:hypothetical protein